MSYVIDCIIIIDYDYHFLCNMQEMKACTDLKTLAVIYKSIFLFAQARSAHPQYAHACFI